MKKLGFIGCGNMGEAMLAGVLRNEWAKAEDIIVHTKRAESSNALKEKYHINVAPTNRAVVQEAEMIILAVKPNIYPAVLKEVAVDLKAGQTVVGIAPAFTIAAIKRLINQPAVKVVRAMPNTPALIGKGVTGLCFSEQMDDFDRKQIHLFFEAFGRVIEIDEVLMPAIGSVSGSSPAFVYMMIEAMAQGAIEQGLPASQAYPLAAASVEGAASLVLASEEHPAKLRDAVCSAGGTTIAGVVELERNGFKGKLIDAMRRSENRFQTLERDASGEA